MGATTAPIGLLCHVVIDVVHSHHFRGRGVQKYYKIQRIKKFAVRLRLIVISKATLTVSQKCPIKENEIYMLKWTGGGLQCLNPTQGTIGN